MILIMTDDNQKLSNLNKIRNETICTTLKNLKEETLPLHIAKRRGIRI